jgi:ribosomal protein S4
VKVGDEIAIRESAKKLLIVEQGAQYAAQNPVPAWLEANFDTFTGRVLLAAQAQGRQPADQRAADRRTVLEVRDQGSGISGQLVSCSLQVF